MASKNSYTQYIIGRNFVKQTNYERINTGRRRKAKASQNQPIPMTAQEMDTAYQYRQRAKREKLLRLADVNYEAGACVFAALTFRENLKTCCFTGHRQLPSGERAVITNKLECVITALYQRGIRYYGAGGALGFGTLAAQAVLRLRESCPSMKLILALPCLTQTRGWKPEDVVEYKRIKDQADRVVYTSQQYTPVCWHKRNRHLVDNSGICVCYLAKNSGGTACTVRYAMEQRLEIINIANVDVVPYGEMSSQ